MIFVEGNNMDEILISTIKLINQNGIRANPRGMWIKEILGYGFTLQNPRNRLIYNPERKFALPFALGEFLWYLRGSDSCDIISYYNSKYVKYSDDKLTLNGAYGKRIFSSVQDNKSQWDKIVEKLKSDNCSRQAVISIYSKEDIFTNSKDIPCTSTIQFFIRDNKLNCIVNMRSNDLIWGTCYDVFNFTMLQELLVRELEVELGWYKHIAGSMHIYEYHSELVQRILKSEYEVYEMPKMSRLSEEAKHKLLECEEKYRNGMNVTYTYDKFWGNICKVLKLYSIKKHRLNEDKNIYLKDLPFEYKYYWMSKGD